MLKKKKKTGMVKRTYNLSVRLGNKKQARQDDPGGVMASQSSQSVSSSFSGRACLTK